MLAKSPVNIPADIEQDGVAAAGSPNSQEKNSSKCTTRDSVIAACCISPEQVARVMELMKSQGKADNVKPPADTTTLDHNEEMTAQMAQILQLPTSTLQPPSFTRESSRGTIVYSLSEETLHERTRITAQYFADFLKLCVQEGFDDLQICVAFQVLKSVWDGYRSFIVDKGNQIFTPETHLFKANRLFKDALFQFLLPTDNQPQSPVRRLFSKGQLHALTSLFGITFLQHLRLIHYMMMKPVSVEITNIQKTIETIGVSETDAVLPVPTIPAFPPLNQAISESEWTEHINKERESRVRAQEEAERKAQEEIEKEKERKRAEEEERLEAERQRDRMPKPLKKLEWVDVPTIAPSTIQTEPTPAVESQSQEQQQKPLTPAQIAQILNDAISSYIPNVLSNLDKELTIKMDEVNYRVEWMNENKEREAKAKAAEKAKKK